MVPSVGFTHSPLAGFWEDFEERTGFEANLTAMGARRKCIKKHTSGELEGNE